MQSCALILSKPQIKLQCHRRWTSLLFYSHRPDLQDVGKLLRDVAARESTFSTHRGRLCLAFKLCGRPRRADSRGLCRAKGICPRGSSSGTSRLGLLPREPTCQLTQQVSVCGGEAETRVTPRLREAQTSLLPALLWMFHSLESNASGGPSVFAV